ncbi:MAG TPA: hypothetical protein VFY65_17640 [Longimicrobium sp.]|nr:hypothetical protein [Longimicrobium sp.]
MAVVDNGGRSARNPLRNLPETEIQLAGSTSYYRTGPFRLMHQPIASESGESSCGSAAFSVERWTGASINPEVPDYTVPFFSAVALRNDIYSIQAATSGNIVINAGEPYKLVWSAYMDNYLGSETAYYDDEAGGTIPETITFQFEQKSIEFKKVPC